MRSLILLLFSGLLISAAPKRDWDSVRAQMRQALRVPDQLPPIAEKLYGRFSPVKDVTADRVSYATAYGLRVPAIVYHQAGATITKHPALIIVNGHAGDKSSWYAYWAGILYARAGAVVLTYDPIGEFERNWQKRSETRQHDTELTPDEMALRLSGLMITDILQANRYLAQRSDVDPKSIGVLGYSMGSLVSSFACAIDTSIRACVLADGGDLDGPGGYWDSSAKMCQGLPYQALRFLGDRGPMIYALNASRGPTLIYDGSADKRAEFFDELHQKTVALWGSKKDAFDYQLLEGGGHSPYFVTKPVAFWLQEKLKFPSWTKKQILEMAETPMNGVLALGTDIPAISRDDLKALPDLLWNAEQDNYVYESWRSRAK